jgi:hypothetical protein
MKQNKEEYKKLINLFMHQGWLVHKKEALNDLFALGEDTTSKNLIYSLLERFKYISNDSYNLLLNEITDYIINDSGFEKEKIQLLSLTYEDETDSSQKILYDITNHLYSKGWRSIKTVNMFGKGVKAYNKHGKTQIIAIDEFIGSGKTLRIRHDWISKNIVGEFKIVYVFVAGIEQTINELIKEGINIICPLQLKKGISEYYNGEELLIKQDIMLDLELKLAQKINDKELYTYSFGYGDAQALYSLEDNNGNTPNSVFPIFWWLKDKEERERNTLLSRRENGF